MKVKEFSTFFKITDPDPCVEDLAEDLSTVNFHTDEIEPYVYFYNEDKEIYRVPKGIGKEKLREYLNINKIDKGGISKTDHRITFSMNNHPFKKQTKVIDKSFKHFQNNNNQVIINMPTGRGKTFTGIYLNHKLNRKALVFVYENKLGEQWAEAYLEHTDVNEGNIVLIDGSSHILDLVEHGYQFQTFIVTHATVRSFIKRYGVKKFNEFLFNSGIAMKIYDEFDRESANMFKVDCHTSLPYTLYLSATPFRSSKYDDSAFQLAFEDVFQIGVEFYSDVTPNRDAEFIFYKSLPTDEEEDDIFQWRFNPKYKKNNSKKKWLNYFDRNKYHAFLLGFEEDYEPRKYLKRALKKPMEDFKHSYNVDPTRKHIFCVGRIKNCMKMKKLLIKEFDIPRSDISLYNSNTNNKDRALNKPFIISLTTSMGRGLDLDNIYGIVDIEAYGSEVRFKQLIGRLGRVGGMKGHYYKLIDTSLFKTYSYYKKLKNHLDEFKNVRYEKIECEEGDLPDEDK